MPDVSTDELKSFVNENIDDFHKRRLETLKKAKLENLLKRKNLYMFSAKNITEARALITELLNAKLSSSEEELFGEFLENVAIFVAGKAYGGNKSSSEGIDLEFSDGTTYYLVSVKSGENWGNSSQHKKLEIDFTKAMTRLRQNRDFRNAPIKAIIGICYGPGRIVAPERKVSINVIGQEFWKLISGKEELYKQIVEPIGYKASEHVAAFNIEKEKIIDAFTEKFTDTFCDQEENIDWDKLIEFNSGFKVLKRIEKPLKVFTDS